MAIATPSKEISDLLLAFKINPKDAISAQIVIDVVPWDVVRITVKKEKYLGSADTKQIVSELNKFELISEPKRIKRTK